VTDLEAIADRYFCHLLEGQADHHLHFGSVPQRQPGIPVVQFKDHRHAVVQLGGEGIARSSDDREALDRPLGADPLLAKDEKVGFKSVNARAESVATAPAFREA
jgi:putative SOS response-associated peptidase YedK